MVTVGHKIIRFKRVTSTNDVLKRGDHRSAPDGLVVVADEQTHGRGRGGGVWHSKGARGLYFSILLRPDFSPQYLGLLSLIPAISCVRAIGQFSPVPAKVKWPNDIFLCERKVGGILVEAKTAGSTLRQVIIGIGVNISQSENDFPAGLRETAGSILSCTGVSADFETLLKSILNELDVLYCTQKVTHGSGGDIASQWMELCAHLQQEITIVRDGVSVSGIFIGVSELGEAMIRTGENKIKTIYWF